MTILPRVAQMCSTPCQGSCPFTTDRHGGLSLQYKGESGDTVLAHVAERVDTSYRGLYSKLKESSGVYSL